MQGTFCSEAININTTDICVSQLATVDEEDSEIIVFTTRYKADSIRLNLESDQPLVAGATYTIPQDLRVTLAGEVVNLCLVGNADATGGTVTISQRTAGRIVGTYNISFSGQTLSGSFDVTHPLL
jgi:hypothetical protein